MSGILISFADQWPQTRTRFPGKPRSPFKNRLRADEIPARGRILHDRTAGDSRDIDQIVRPIRALHDAASSRTRIGKRTPVIVSAVVGPADQMPRKSPRPRAQNRTRRNVLSPAPAERGTQRSTAGCPHQGACARSGLARIQGENRGEKEGREGDAVEFHSSATIPRREHTNCKPIAPTTTRRMTEVKCIAPPSPPTRFPPSQVTVEEVEGPIAMDAVAAHEDLDQLAICDADLSGEP